MVDITHKKTSLRVATAEATVLCSNPASISAVKNKTVPKGDVFEMAKTAGLFAVKKTSDMIPDCHPLPVESTVISYDINELEIKIKVTVKAIYRTGMEVEAMHGASVVALTMYDMLKPIDKGIEIKSIKLSEKSGGKSDIRTLIPKNILAAILYYNPQNKENKIMTNANRFLANHNVETKVAESFSDINSLNQLIMDSIESKINLIIVFGGTGLSESDTTNKIIRPLLDKELPSVSNLLMSYAAERTFKALVSQPLAGIVKQSIVVSLPGSTAGAHDALTGMVPEILYLFKSINYKQ